MEPNYAPPDKTHYECNHIPKKTIIIDDIHYYDKTYGER